MLFKINVESKVALQPILKRKESPPWMCSLTGLHSNSNSSKQADLSERFRETWDTLSNTCIFKLHSDREQFLLTHITHRSLNQGANFCRVQKAVLSSTGVARLFKTTVKDCSTKAGR